MENYLQKKHLDSKMQLFVILSSGELDLNHSLGHVSRHEVNE